MVLHNVARILELAVPLMDHPGESFLAQLEEDMMKLVLKHGMLVCHWFSALVGAVLVPTPGACLLFMLFVVMNCNMFMLLLFKVT